MDEIKPSETDSSEDMQDIANIFAEEGEENESESTEQLSLSDIEAITGRKFASREEFEKHYKNLSSFVGKPKESGEVKKPAAKQSNDAVMQEIESLKSMIAERDFVAENPHVKEHLDIIRDVAKSRGVSLSDAYESVKDIFGAASAYKKEQEVTVNSVNRINPTASQNFDKAVKNFVPGDSRSESALIDEFYKAKGM